jgi:hypothetical protein
MTRRHASRSGALVIWLAAVIGGGCSQGTYRQVLEEPVHTAPRVELDEESFLFVEASGGGFLWSECARVGDDALKELYEKARAEGYDALTDVEWWDYRERAWTRVPQCRREWGWLSGTIYLAWWPAATKVRVRGKAVDRPVLTKAVAAKAPTARPFKAVGVGPVPMGRTSAEMRRVDDGPVLSAGVFGGRTKGYDLRLGLPEAVDWGFAVEVARTSECCDQVDGEERRVVGSTSVAMLGQWYFGNSFYLVAGPGVEDRAYERVTEERGRRAWRERTAVLQLGVGNEWRTERGWVYGADWLVTSVPVYGLGVTRGSGADARGNERLRGESLWKVFVWRVGRVF